MVDGKRWTSMTLTVELDFIEILKLLIEHGADINRVDAVGATPIAIAVFKGNFGIMNYLKENGANLSIKTEDHNSYEMAMRCHQKNILKQLLY